VRDEDLTDRRRVFGWALPASLVLRSLTAAFLIFEELMAVFG
jgi:hypothetical protein